MTANHTGSTAMVGWTESVSDTRGTADILWSCLATLLACQWSTQHPDMLDEKVRLENNWLKRILFHKSWIKDRLRLIGVTEESIDSLSSRLMACCLGFYGPEWLMGWALIEHQEARRLRDKVNNMHRGEKLWTRTHAYCVLMGGLEIKFIGGGVDESAHIVTEEMLNFVVRDSQLHHALKNLREEDICSTSSTDLLGKVIVGIQMCWFSIQLFARWSQQLPISQLELATAAYVLFTIPTLLLYLQKPCVLRRRYTINIAPDWDLYNNVQGSDSQPANAIQKATPKLNFGTFAGHIGHVVGASESMFVPQCLRVKHRHSHSNSETREERQLREWCRKASNRWAMFTSSIGALFACCHLLAWNYPFPTNGELWAWRTINVLTIIIPASYFLLRALRTIMNLSTEYAWAGVSTEKGLSKINRAFIWGLFVMRLYICAALISSLRLQPASLYNTVSWTKLIPHFH